MEKKDKDISVGLNTIKLEQLIKDVNSGKTHSISSFDSTIRFCKITDDIERKITVGSNGKILIDFDSELFSAKIEFNPTIEETSLIINKWLEKVSKLKEEMKMLSK